MELKVERKWKKPTYTIGNLYVDGVFLCNVLEDKDRGLTQDMSTTEIYKKKVYGSTCVPAGRYRIDMNRISSKFKNRGWAAKYGGRVPHVENVPCWTAVLWHPGNDPSCTQGCLLPGFNKQKGKVLDSQKCFFKLMDEYLEPARMRGEEIWMTIK